MLTEVTTYRSRLAQNLPRLRDRMSAAALKVGRDPSGVALVAVTKGHPSDAVEAALEMGLTDLGENRVEELAQKVALLGRAPMRWHLIGHVQRRKAQAAASLPHLFHALDSVRLAEKMSRILVAADSSLSVLIQVNTSGEQAKGGLDLDAALDGIALMAELPGLDVAGLMTMAPFVSEERVLRDTFAELRRLHERAREATAYDGTELSMGMTNDFEVAIEEGSTMVRVGTALFGERR